MRKFRTLDVEILALPNITPELKLVLAEILSWSSYYKVRMNAQYRYNPVQVSYAVGLPIFSVVMLIDKLVKANILSVGEDRGFNTLYPSNDEVEAVRLLSVLK